MKVGYISFRILSRERGGIIREFYKNIYPNLTIINVEKPAGFLRKFSPDGKYLIAFTYDQTSLEIYRFKGSGAAAVSFNIEKTLGDLLTKTKILCSALVRHNNKESCFRFAHIICWSINVLFWFEIIFFAECGHLKWFIVALKNISTLFPVAAERLGRRSRTE